LATRLIAACTSALSPSTASGLVVYEKYCHYFSLTGVHDVRVSAGLTEEDAARVFCPLLRNEKAIELTPDDL
jgi:hypothetical protein